LFASWRSPLGQTWSDAARPRDQRTARRAQACASVAIAAHARVGATGLAVFAGDLIGAIEALLLVRAAVRGSRADGARGALLAARGRATGADRRRRAHLAAAGRRAAGADR